MGIVFETEEECLSAVKRECFNLRDCAIKSHEVCMTAWNQNKDTIRFFPEEELTEEIQREYAIEVGANCDLSVFTFMDEEMALALVEKDSCVQRPGYKAPNICFLAGKFPEVVTDKVVEAAVKATPWIAYKFKDRLSSDFLKEWALAEWTMTLGDENGKIFAEIRDEEVYRKALAGMPEKIVYLPPDFEELKIEIIRSHLELVKYSSVTKEVAFLVLSKMEEHRNDACFRVEDFTGIPWGNAFDKKAFLALEDWQLKMIMDGISSRIDKESDSYRIQFDLVEHEEWRSTIELLKDSDVARRILKISPSHIRHFIHLKGDCDLVDYAIEQNGEVLSKIGTKYMTEERVQLALDHGFHNLDRLPERLKTDEIVKQCVANGYRNLEDILPRRVAGVKEILFSTEGTKLRDDDIRAILDADWERDEKFAYIKNQRFGLCLNIVKRLTTEELKDKELLVLLASKNYDDLFHHLGRAGFSKEEIAEIADLAVKDNYGCIPYCSKKAKTGELAWNVYHSAEWYYMLREFDSLPEDLVKQAITDGLIGTGTFTIHGKENSNQLKILMTTQELAWYLVEKSPKLSYNTLHLIPENFQSPELQVTAQLRLKEKDSSAVLSHVFPKGEEYSKLLGSVTPETVDETVTALHAYIRQYDWRQNEDSRSHHLRNINPDDVLTLDNPTDRDLKTALEAKPILAQEVYDRFELTLELVGGTRSELFQNLRTEIQNNFIKEKVDKILEKLSTIQQQTNCFNFSDSYEVDASKLFAKIECNTNLQLYESTEKMEFKYNAKYCSVGFANHWANVYYPVKEITDGSVELADPEGNGILTLLQVESISVGSELSEYSYLVSMDSILQIFEGFEEETRRKCLPVILGDFSKALIFKDKIIIPLDISINSLKEMIELVPDWLGLKEPSDEMSSF